MKLKFYSKRTFAFLFGVCSSLAISAQTITVDLTSATGTWTVPAGVTQITVEGWGGGGGGGKATTGWSGNGCAGGGGGAYAKKNAITVTPGQVISYSIGQGGSGDNGNNPGGDTWFLSNTVLLAKGGGGVADNILTAPLGGQASASVGDVVFSGGNGGAGSQGSTSFDAGGGGGAAGTTANGMNGGPGDNGASTAGTNGTRAGGSAGAGYPFTSPNTGRGGNGSDNDGTGDNSARYGAGGGGGKIGTAALIHRNGGNGSQGVIRITYCLAPVLAGSITGTASVCENASQVFSAPTIAGATYNWTLPNSWTGTSTSNGITATAGPTGGVIQVSATTSCGTSLATLSVNVSTLGLANAPSAITGQTNICAGSNHTFSVVNDPSAASYTWTLPNGWTGTSASNSISVSPDNTSGVISVVANSAACGSSTASTITVNTLAVPVTPLVLNGNTTVCEGSVQTYFVNNDPTVANYIWTLPNGWSGTSTSSSMNATVGNAGGNIEVAASNACGVSADIAVSVNIGQPTTETLQVVECGTAVVNGITYSSTGQFTQHLVNQQGCDSILTVAVQLTNVSAAFSKIGNIYSASQVGVNYKWVACNDLSTTLNSTNQFTPSQNGQYRLIVEKDGCSDTSNCFTYAKVGLENQTNAFTYTIFPNPASELLNVDLKSTTMLDNASLSIVDMTGRAVLMKNLTKLMENQTIQVDISGLKSGVYFVQINGKGIQLPTKKLVIQ